MSYTSLAQSAVDWALSKVGCAYSQAQRTQEDIFDCSSLVARAYSAQGKRWKYGGSVPTSNKEIYDDDFELLWPATYAQIGKSFGGASVINMAKQPGVTRKEAQEALLRSLGEILPVCEEQGVLFAVECVYYHAMNTPEAVKMVLDTIASPNLRVLCDFANYVGPEDASLDAQRRIWDKVGSWYGDKIAAVHFKGQNFRPDGTLYSTSLEDSCVDYAGSFAMLKQMPQAAFPVLREEAVPARAASDIAFMRKFCE